MPTLTIGANDVIGAVSIQVRYRILGSSDTFEVVTLSPDELPYAVVGVANGQYEVGVRKLCTNGAYSDWISGQSTACPAIISFTASLSGTNLVIVATLAAPQSKIQVLITDPNGGQQVTNHDFGGQTGTFNIAILNTLLYGDYSITARGVCDDTVTPIYASTYASNVTVNYPAP